MEIFRSTDIEILKLLYPHFIPDVGYTRDMILSETYPEYVRLGRLEIRASPYIDKKIIDYRFYIKTLEGDMEIRIDDWLITGVNGEHYPCKPDIFEKTYEYVPEYQEPDIDDFYNTTLDNLEINLRKK